jgi:hypothetical protein
MMALLADVYPAQIVINPGPEARVQDRVRVIVQRGDPNTNTPARLTAFADSSQGPRAVYSQALQDFTSPLRPQRLREAREPAYRRYTATTASGIPVYFEKTGGCGCGSRLKSFNPFPSLTMLAAPSR